MKALVVCETARGLTQCGLTPAGSAILAAAVGLLAAIAVASVLNMLIGGRR